MQTVRYHYTTIPIPINNIGMRLPHGTDNTSIVQKLLTKAQLLLWIRIGGGKRLQPARKLRVFRLKDHSGAIICEAKREIPLDKQ